ncbi:MAG: M20/M25/M40 family metallo-hydrolase, partial [Sulfolobales archaeon]
AVKRYGGAPAVFGDVGSGSKTVLIYNHYDVQPPEPLELWSSDPFKLEVRDDLLIGRGVADNKGNIVARIGALDSLLEYLDILDLRVKFLIEGEEEVGVWVSCWLMLFDLDPWFHRPWGTFHRCPRHWPPPVQGNPNPQLLFI